MMRYGSLPKVGDDIINKMFVDWSGASVTPWGIASGVDRRLRTPHSVAIYLRESEVTSATSS